MKKIAAESIADILREARYRPFPLEAAVRGMAGLLEATSPQFDKRRFYVECEQGALVAEFDAMMQQTYGERKA